MERKYKQKNFLRPLICLLFATVMVLGLLASASAADHEWKLLTDNGTDFRVEGQYSAWENGTESDGTPYVQNKVGKRGSFFAHDEKNVLGTLDAFAVEGDFYFSAFPSGLRGEYTPSESPLSFFAWIYKDAATGASSKFNSVRIDNWGYIYGSSGKTDTQLRVGRWYNIRCVFVPESGMGEFFLNGKKMFDFTFTRFDPALYTSGAVRFFDGYYDWGVKMKNLSIQSLNNYEIKLLREDAADFLGYQVSKPQNGTFTLRAVLGVDNLVGENVGYEVLVLDTNKAGEIVSTVYSSESEIVHDALLDGKGNLYNIQELSGYAYAAALEVPNLPAKPTGSQMEIVIRPYVLMADGIRRYGLATSLLFAGKTDAEGYPVLSAKTGERLMIEPTDDTYVYGGARDQNYGDSTSLLVRNTGTESSGFFRAPYFKFTLDAQAVKALDTATSVKLRICITSHEDNDTRKQYDMILQAVGTDWDEHSLNYNNYTTKAATGETIYQGEYKLGSYFTVDILSYLKKQSVNKDGTITVAFRLINEGHSDAIVAFVGSKESHSGPTIEFENSMYYPALNLEKAANTGYEPWGYAEYLVDQWFEETVDMIYLKDANGNPLYYDINTLNPEGYGATEATGDFTEVIDWIHGTTWTTNAANGYKITDSSWKRERFARTLSTLGTSTAVSFLESEFAGTISEYDVYGGITNAGFKGKATGFFHTQKVGNRTYIIDPLGNPYFALGINTVDLGFTANQKEYALNAYGSEQAYYEGIVKELKATGINLVHGGGEILNVEEGIPTVIGLSIVLPYMNSIGAGRGNFTNGFANNDTMNVFDPDFVTATNQRVAQTINDGGYANNPYVFGYTSDNELASGDDILLRYLTLDPTEPVNSFSYAIAWTWLARRTGVTCPTLDTLHSLENYEQINDEFLSFVYARFYDVTREAIRAVDPNHMYLGSRINGTLYTCEPYHRVAGYYLDIITANLYGGLNPNTSTITGFYRNAGIPFIVTEFFAKGSDAIDANGYLLANSTGAGIVVKTQQDRADYYEHYALTMLESGACVGWSWYCFRDNDQSVFTSDGINRLIMLNVTYGPGAHPNTFMDVDTGKIYTAEEIGDYEMVYKGADMHSNQNINKGLYNGTFSSTVTIYEYDKNGTLISSQGYDVEHPSSRTPKSGTVLTGVNGGTYKIGTVKKSDGSYTETILTVYRGQYVVFADAIKNVSDHLMGLVQYFDAQSK